MIILGRNECMKDAIVLTDKTIPVTGSPGFIGTNLVMRLLQEMQAGYITLEQTRNLSQRQK